MNITLRIIYRGWMKIHLTLETQEIYETYDECTAKS